MSGYTAAPSTESPDNATSPLLGEEKPNGSIYSSVSSPITSGWLLGLALADVLVSCVIALALYRVAKGGSNSFILFFSHVSCSCD